MEQPHVEAGEGAPPPDEVDPSLSGAVDETEAPKKKRRRRGAKLGRQQSGGKQKKVRSNAGAAQFPGTASAAVQQVGGGDDEVAEALDTASAASAASAKKSEQKKKMKSLQNKAHYQGRKSAKKSETIEELKDVIEEVSLYMHALMFSICTLNTHHCCSLFYSKHKSNAEALEHLNNQKDKIVASALKSAELTAEKLKSTRHAFGSFRDRKEKELRGTKAKAKATVARLKSQYEEAADAQERAHERDLRKQQQAHTSELRATKSAAFREVKHASKSALLLQEKLEKSESVTAQQIALLEEQNRDALEHAESTAAAQVRALERQHQKDLKQVQAAHYQQARAASNTIVELEDQLADAVNAKEAAEAEMNFAVKAAVKDAKVSERQHYTAVISKKEATVSALGAKLDAAAIVNTALVNRAVTAERAAERLDRAANTSAKRSKEMLLTSESLQKALNESLEREKGCQSESKNVLYYLLHSFSPTYFSSVVIEQLQEMLDDSQKKLAALEDAVPIKTIERKREGQHGAKSWSYDIWELILEQLVNGTPPSSVADNIVAHVKKFSPTTKIKELPSIWTIRRARTVLLVIVQTLAAYRLGKAERWIQIHTDGTGRQQTHFQNLLISIEEDELFQ